MKSENDVRFLDKTSPPHISTLILLSGIGALAMNMFLPSLPSMAEYFETDYSVMQLSVPLYLLFSAGLQLIIGPVSDNLGRRNVLLWGLVIYMIATVGCIYAPTTAVFLICRCAQAIIAVSMVLSRAVVRDMFSQDKAASMIGYVTMGMAVVPMITPAIGGVLDQVFGWQATFWAMFLVGAFVFAQTWYDLGETSVRSGKTMRQQFSEYPELLKSPRFWGYSMAAACCSGAFFAYLGGAPFVGSEVFGMQPAELGIYFGAPAIGYFVGNFITARTATTLGVNTLVLCGCLANAVGGAVSMLIFLAGYGSPLSFFGMMTLVGLGNGLCIPNATAGLLSVRPHLAGTASGLGGAVMIGGGAGLSILAGSLLSTETGAYPLLWIMLGTAVAGVASILVVIRREKTLGLS
ncbi:multidrug effflux MFS transporter [Sulfitobacter sp. CW3]|jgi:DHA1 family bicyclomycin/chloramphenicol resistance-like MFS transporter|uniref:multidrug effflux MFS transporter n=1 Tax=Sulfitobacter sp. CW3 TaxID=2861965 RepID=UPI001C5EEC17|nr:multidrug effflux MFS transporter [Sulfitobacter sp. CW3]MBW4963183.1 multidrug effflux MFS transporter [Sulfitobacter sp. CW3]